MGERVERKLIEGKPVLVVIDIQGGESRSDEPSGIPMCACITRLLMDTSMIIFAAL